MDQGFQEMGVECTQRRRRLEHQVESVFDLHQAPIVTQV
jgi:hypothetical protein